MSHSKVHRILLIDDNLADIRLTQEGFKEAKVQVHLDVAEDAYQALEYLHQKNKWSQTPRPQLILLDLNLPGKSGTEFLAQIKDHPELRKIPVVVLTSSKAATDILTCYELQASCCIQKPVEFEDFVEMIKSIDEFWLKQVVFPM